MFPHLQEGHHHLPLPESWAWEPGPSRRRLSPACPCLSPQPWVKACLLARLASAGWPLSQATVAHPSKLLASLLRQRSSDDPPGASLHPHWNSGFPFRFLRAFPCLAPACFSVNLLTPDPFLSKPPTPAQTVPPPSTQIRNMSSWSSVSRLSCNTICCCGEGRRRPGAGSSTVSTHLSCCPETLMRIGPLH